MTNQQHSTPKAPRIMISGGGTGGHVFPAIAIADAIREQEPTAEIRFVGAEGKLEMEKVPQAGYPIDGLWISGIQRSLTLRNMIFPLKLMSSLWKAARLIQRYRPQVVVGVGGYASGPLLEMATRLGVPALIQEQNSYAGLTNRLLAKRVQRICVAYPGMERYFPAEKLVETGNPVRAAFGNPLPDRQLAAEHFQLDPQRKIALVVGGSLGARSLNEGMIAGAEQLKADPGIQVIWQCGKLYHTVCQESATAQLPQVKLMPFIDRMDLAYAAADVVICRAGALTISELCLLGKPAILVPSPNVAEDHQTKNAQALVNAQAALMLTDSAVRTELIPQLSQLLGDETLRKQLAEQARNLGKPEAAKTIANEVLALVK